MRRLFWLVTGVTVGVLAVRKLQNTAQRWSASNIGRTAADAVRDLSGWAAAFAADVRQGMREQEAVLREAAGLDSGPVSAPREQALSRPSLPTAQPPAPQTHSKQS